MKLELSRQIFEKYSSVKFNENPFSGTELFHLYSLTDGQTDTSQLIVTFREEKFNMLFDFEMQNSYNKYTPKQKTSTTYRQV
jgi:hypothetical protein